MLLHTPLSSWRRDRPSAIGDLVNGNTFRSYPTQPSIDDCGDCYTTASTTNYLLKYQVSRCLGTGNRHLRDTLRYLRQPAFKKLGNL